MRRRGALHGLWSDLTDRSAAGDARALLSKYGSGLGLGCMGIPFLGVGALILILFGRQAGRSGQSVVPMILFGSIFALAGVFLITQGGRTIWSRASKQDGSTDGD